MSTKMCDCFTRTACLKARTRYARSMATIGEIEKLAYDLPASDRALVAAHLLRSLPPVLEDEDEGLAEALRRDAELDAKPSLSMTLDKLDRRIAYMPRLRLVLHPGVASDVSEVMGQYQRVACRELAEEFFEELRGMILAAAGRPESCSNWERDLRRLDLPHLPYHLIFRIPGDWVRLLAVRHNKRDPSLKIGLR